LYCQQAKNQQDPFLAPEGQCRYPTRLVDGTVEDVYSKFRDASRSAINLESDDPDIN
jgi:hypothetical protein